jgi:hypothetical protein
MRHFFCTENTKKSAKSTGPIPIDFLCISVHTVYTADDDSSRGLFLATPFTFAEENLRWGQLRTPGFPDSLQAPLQCREGFDLRSMICVEGLYSKRPIQCLASSKILTPHPPHRPASVYPTAFGAGVGHTRWVEGGCGGGANILEDARRCSVYTLHM